MSPFKRSEIGEIYGDSSGELYFSYKVKSGEDLSSIAKKFITDKSTLLSINNLSAGSIRPGRTILVPFY